MSRNRYLRNVTSSWFVLLWELVLALVMMPLFITTLGKTNYGIWLLITSLVGYFGLCDLGIRQAVVRLISELLAKGDEDALNETFNTCLIFNTAMGILVVGASGGLALLLPRIEGFAAGQHPNSSLLIFLVGISIGISFPRRVFAGVLSAAERFDIKNLIVVSLSLVRNLGMVGVLLSGGGLLGMAWVLVGTTVVGNLVAAAAVFFVVPRLRLAPTAFRRKRLKKIAGHSIHNFLIRSGDQVRLSTESIVIGLYLPAEAITIFNIGNRPLQYLSKAARGISHVLIPAFSRTDATNQCHQLERLLLLGTRATALLTGLGSIILFVCGDRLLSLWLGAGFDKSALILLVLIPSHFLASSLIPIESILLGTSRHKFLSLATIAEAIVNLVLSIWLIQSLGLIGVALGTAIPMFVIRFLVLPVYTCRALNLSLTGFFKRSLLPALPPLLGSGLLSVTLVKWIPGGDLFSVMMLVGLVGLTYGILALATMIGRGDELLPAECHTWFRNKWKRVGTSS